MAFIFFFTHIGVVLLCMFVIALRLFIKLGGAVLVNKPVLAIPLQLYLGITSLDNLPQSIGGHIQCGLALRPNLVRCQDMRNSETIVNFQRSVGFCYSLIKQIKVDADFGLTFGLNGLR